MESSDDSALLRQYCAQYSEDAFAALIARHINLVYSVALRQVGNPHHAEEISQAVFIILAKKAGGLRHDKALSSWLFQTTHLTCKNFIRSEMRRHRREQEAHMQSMLEEPENSLWERIAPLLDSAVAALNEKDRRAVVLRFYEGRNLRDVGAEFGTSEEAAKKRVARALEKLRRFFARRGVNSTTAVIGEEISAHSMQAAPAALAKSVAAIAVSKGAAASTSTLTLIKGALKIMAWTKAKMAVVVVTGLILVTGTTTVVVKEVAPALRGYPAWADDPKVWSLNSRSLLKLPPAFILRPTRFPHDGGGVTSGNRVMFKNASIPGLMEQAYGFSAVRIVFPQLSSKEIIALQKQYDLLLTLPSPFKQTLQQAIRERFGLVAHPETRDADVLLLRVHQGFAPGLQVSSRKDMGSWSATRHEVIIKNQPFGPYADSLESTFGKPVINQTDLDGTYDIHIQWQPNPSESEQDALQRALLNQLGLELIPTNMPIEMLVVEKAK